MKRNIQQEKLFEAIENRNFELAKKCIDAGVSPDATDKDGVPALYRALVRNEAKDPPSERIVMLLLKAGSEPDKPGDAQVTPLMWACKYGFKRAVEFFISKKVKINAKSKNGYGVFTLSVSPLSLAAENKHIELVRMLIKAGANVNLNLGKNRTPFLSAVQSEDIRIVRIFLSAGARPTGYELFSAISQKQLNIVELLISAGADVNVAEGRWNYTVLRACVASGDAKIMAAIIKAGAKLDASADGRTALIFAVCKQRLDMVELLLKAGAKPDVRDWVYNSTALMSAVTFPDKKIVTRLIQAGANPRLKDKNGVTALAKARKYGHVVE